MRFEQIWAGCVGKATYDTKADALSRLRFSKKGGRRGGESRARVAPYRCRNCHGWHLGSERYRAPERGR